MKDPRYNVITNTRGFDFLVYLSFLGGNEMKRYGLILVLIVGIMLTSFAAEMKTVDPRLTPQAPNMGGTLVRSFANSPQSFSFYGSLDNIAYTIAGQFLDPLVEANPIDYSLEPALAKSWDVSDDQKVVTFHLRDVKWSDGTPLTSDDVIFTFEKFVMNRFAEGNSIDRFTLGGQAITWEKVDDKTLKAHLPTPYGAFYTVLSHVLIYPKHILADKIDPNDPGSVNRLWTTDTPLNQIVGTGPFVLSQYIVDQKVVMKKNPNFWKQDKWGNQLPYADTLEYLIIRDPEVTNAKFMAGELVAMTIAARDYPMFKQRELDGAPFVVYRAEPVNPTPSPLHITFNLDVHNPELRDVFRKTEFRAAMEYALDRERIIDEVYNTLAVLGGVPVLPANADFYNPNIEQLRRGFDLDQAKALLDYLGLVDRNGDGWRQFPSGNRLSFVLITSTAQDYVDISYIFSETLKSIGVDCVMQVIDGALRNQRALAGDFEACLWAFGNQPDPQLRKAIWQPGNPLYYNHLSTMHDETRAAVYENMMYWEKIVFQMFELGEATMDPAKRKLYYDIWQEIYAVYVPFIFVCKGMDLLAVARNIGNYYQLPEGMIVGTNYTIFVKN